MLQETTPDVAVARKPRFATVWLGGCAGCHMSFLDIDEWLIDLVGLVDVVYTPIADIKEFPEAVDLVLVEGAIANEDNHNMAIKLRERSRIVIAFGDCAVTGNVTAMRNPIGTANAILKSCYVDPGDLNAQIPNEPGIVPVLLDRVQPLHEVIHVDKYIHGCPPSGPQIRAALEAILADHYATPEASAVKFG